MLGRVGPEFLVKIDGEQCAARIEHARERTHQRAEQPRHHDPAHARRQHVLHHQRKRRLRALRVHAAAHHQRIRQRRHFAALGQGEADHPRNDENEHRQQLQERGEKTAAARLALIGGAKRALHDVLVRAPVPQADNRRAEQHAQPREIAVEIPGDAVLLDHRRPRALHALGNQRLPQVEHVGAENLAKFRPAAHVNEPENGDQQRTDDQHHRLQRLRVGHRAQPPQHRVQAGQQNHRHRAHPEAVERGEADVEPHLRQQGGEDDPAREDAHRDLCQHIGHKRDHRQHVARRFPKAFLEKLRHGEHQGA